MLKNENFIVIQGFMINELGLKGNELIIYAIIYGFSQDGENKYTGSLNYLANWTNSTKQGVLKSLKSLLDKGYIIKEEKYINGVKFCEYYTTKFNGGIKQSLTGGIKQSLPNNIDNNNIYNNIDTTSCSNEVNNTEIYNLYEQLGFGTINIASISDIDMLIEENTFEYVKNAMLEANRKGIRRLDYVMGILKDWKVNGMKTSIDKYKTEPKEENKNNRLEEFNKRLAEMQKKKKKVDKY